MPFGTGLLVLYAALLVLIPIASYLMARAALAPLQKSYELQQRFVDGASHVMRSPLSIIQGELELALLTPRTPAEYERAMQTALGAVDGLIQLTDDLLLLSRGAGALAASPCRTPASAWNTATCSTRSSGIGDPTKARSRPGHGLGLKNYVLRTGCCD